MKEAKESVLGLLLLINIAYLIWGDYDGISPYITLGILLFFVTRMDDKKEVKKFKKKEDIPEKAVETLTYPEFKKKIMHYKKTYSNTPPILKVYVDEKIMDEIKQNFKEGYFHEATLDSIIDDYEPLEFSLMDFEVFIRTKYFKENSLYPTKSKLLKVSENKANKEIRFWYNAQFSEAIKDIDSIAVRESLLFEAKQKLDDVEVEYI